MDEAILEGHPTSQALVGGLTGNFSKPTWPSQNPPQNLLHAALLKAHRGTNSTVCVLGPSKGEKGAKKVIIGTAPVYTQVCSSDVAATYTQEMGPIGGLAESQDGPELLGGPYQVCAKWQQFKVARQKKRKCCTFQKRFGAVHLPSKLARVSQRGFRTRGEKLTGQILKQHLLDIDKNGRVHRCRDRSKLLLLHAAPSLMLLKLMKLHMHHWAWSCWSALVSG
eukprot:1158384-Pelagomonas_calceolata.AAC.12